MKHLSDNSAKRPSSMPDELIFTVYETVQERSLRGLELLHHGHTAWNTGDTE